MRSGLDRKRRLFLPSDWIEETHSVNRNNVELTDGPTWFSARFRSERMRRSVDETARVLGMIPPDALNLNLDLEMSRVYHPLFGLKSVGFPNESEP